VSSPQAQTIHPEIASIIRKRDEIHRLIFIEYRPRKALDLMVGLLYSIRREHRPEGLLEEIHKERHFFMEIRSRKQREQYANRMRFKYEDYYQQLSDVLNDEGYLLAEFYTSGFWDTAKGRKSGKGS
jgi:hypothetical protein